jgi:hypothetical protein
VEAQPVVSAPVASMDVPSRDIRVLRIEGLRRSRVIV